MIFLYLFITFFEIGLFGFGGGYGMLSLIQHETVTYCGYTAIHNAGYGHLTAILGSATATFALVLPSLILMILISKLFMRYMHHHSVESIFAALRPAVVGLLAAATLLLCTRENFSSPKEDLWQFCISCFLFVSAFYGVKVVKINPIRMILYCAVAGLILL